MTSDRADAGSQRRGQWQVVAGGLLLGTMGAFFQQAGQDPLTTVWFRCAFGALALLLWALATGRRSELSLRGAGLVSATACALLMLANWILFFAAIERTSIALATVVFHVQPFWVMAIGALWLGEPVSRRQALAAGLALLGLVLATGLADLLAGLRQFRPREWWGLAMCLGGSLSYAGVTLIAVRARGAGPAAMTWWQCLLGTLLLAPWPWLHGWPVLGMAWCWLAGLGVLHTALAYRVIYAGMARLPAGRVAVLQFVYPVTAIAVDALVYDRWLRPTQWLGVGLMLIGLVAIRLPPGAARAATAPAAAGR